MGLRGCQSAPEWKASPTRYVVKRADLFNSRRSECAPMFLGTDNDLLYFCSTNDKASGDKKNDITGLKNNDIFFARKDEKAPGNAPNRPKAALTPKTTRASSPSHPTAIRCTSPGPDTKRG